MFLLSAVLVAACSHDRPAPTPSTETSASQSTGYGWATDSCPSQAICAVYDGLPTIAIVPQGSVDVILVDGGGPGISLQAIADNVGDLGIRKGVGVVAVGESWEVEKPRPACLRQESARLGALPAEAPSTSCNLTAAGFSPPAYKAALAGVLQTNGLNLIGAIGISFGAIRTAATIPSDVPLLLVTPAPAPQNISVDDLAMARSKSVIQSVTKQCRRDVGCRGSLQELLDNQDDRDSYNKVLGLLAATSQGQEVREAVANLDENGDSDYWRRLAFASTFRFGKGAVLPNMIGYRAGTCSAFRPHDEAVELDRFAKAYEAVLDCPRMPKPDFRARPDLKGCIVVSDGDSVAPLRFARSWTTFTGLQMSRRQVPGHGQINDVLRSVISGIPESLQRCE